MSLDLDSVHSWIIKQLLEKRIMTNYFVSNHKDIYSVIIGGINIVRCSKLQPKVSELLGNIYKNDIDAKYIVKKPITSWEDPLINTAHEKRMLFVNQLLSSSKFTKLLKDASIMTQNRVIISAFVQDQRDHAIDNIRLVQRVVIKLEYKLTQEVISEDVVIKKDLIDTGVYHNLIMGSRFNSHQELFPNTKSKLPIPVTRFKGLPTATCVWIYFDTVRMLVESGKEYEAALQDPNSTPSTRRFQYKKFIKYLSKFAVLYMSIYQINKEPEYKVLKNIYKTSQEHISKLKYTKKDTDITEEQKQVLNSLVQLISGKTNFKKIKHLLFSKSPIIKI